MGTERGTMDLAEYLSETRKDCKHSRKKDLTQGLGEERNFYCPTCGAHWYRGKFWTPKEWELYVNDI